MHFFAIRRNKKLQRDAFFAIRHNKKLQRDASTSLQRKGGLFPLFFAIRRKTSCNVMHLFCN